MSGQLAVGRDGARPALPRRALLRRRRWLPERLDHPLRRLLGQRGAKLLAPRVGELFDAYQASRYACVAGRAPLVLNDALRASRTVGADERNRANALLALAYQSAVSVLTKLGETDLA